MEQEPRKATDVLLEVETKLDTALGLIKSLDLNVKILSNKMGELMKDMEKLKATPPKITVEAVQTPIPNQSAAIFGQTSTVDPARAIPVVADSRLEVEGSPQGFRRNSRPESYAGDTYLPRDGVPPPNSPSVLFNQQQNKPPPGRSSLDMPVTDVKAPVQPKPKTATAKPPVSTQPAQKSQTEIAAHGIIPVEQRVVDKNGKSVFLAEVEIVDVQLGEQIFKSKTNGTGKWMAPLPIGRYAVTIKKLESLTRAKVETTQTIDVDGIQSPLKLPMVIIK
jgi:hypothetical protein